MLKRRPKKYDVNLKLSVDDNAYMTVACVVGGTMICTGLNMLGVIITTGSGAKGRTEKGFYRNKVVRK